MKKKHVLAKQLSVLLAICMLVMVTSTFPAARANAEAPVEVPEQQSAVGTTYYVDSVDGNDANDGVTTSSAIKTLEKVNSTTFEPGDRILFKADGIWAGQLWPKGSGEDGKPIVIDMYGTGSKPIINGQGAKTYLDDHWKEADTALLLYNQEYWEINNLELTNTGEQANRRNAVSILCNNYGKVANHIYLKGLDVHDVNSYQQDNADAGVGGTRSFGGIVFFIYGTVPSTYNDILVEGCTVKNLDRTGILVWSNHDMRGSVNYGEGPWVPSTNVVIRNNVLDSIGGDGILVSVCKDPLIEYNVARECQSRSIEANAGMWTHNSDGAVFQYNEVYETKTTIDGMAYDIDIGNNGAVFQYNYSHDNVGGFMLVMCEADPKVSFTRDSIIRYNISQNDRCRTITMYNSPQNTQIYNNTFYIGKDITTEIFHVGVGSVENLNVYNNIFYNLGDAKYYFQDMQLFTDGDIVFDNNCYFGKEVANQPYDANGIMQDPQLTAPGTGGVGRSSAGGYMLEPTSPCINSGRNIPNNGGKDFGGNQVPYGGILSGRIDVGAFEYQGEAAAANTMPKIPEKYPNILVNDSVKVSANSPHNAFEYTGKWEHRGGIEGPFWEYLWGAYDKDTTQSQEKDAFATIKFYGDAINIYGNRNSDGGQAAFSIDGGEEAVVDTYSGIESKRQLIYSSPKLDNGEHILKVRVTGECNPASTGQNVYIDYAEIFNTAINDDMAGNGYSRFDFAGSGWAYSKNENTLSDYLGDLKSSDKVDNFVDVRFIGTGVEYLSKVCNSYGIAAFSIDGKQETQVDFYSPEAVSQKLVYKSPELLYGPHTLRVRVTGLKNENSTGSAISADRVNVIKNYTNISVENDIQITEPVLTNSNGEVLHKLISNEPLNISLNAINMSGTQERNAVMIIALYDGNNKLINKVYVEKSIKTGEALEFKGGLNIPGQAENLALKVFVWDSLESMKALSDVKLFTGK